MLNHCVTVQVFQSKVQIYPSDMDEVKVQCKHQQQLKSKHSHSENVLCYILTQAAVVTLVLSSQRV